MADLNAHDVTRQERRTLLSQGRLVRVGPGLLRLVGHPSSWQATLLGHCSRTDGRAFATSAAVLYRLGQPRDLSPGHAEVLVPSRSRPATHPKVKLYRGAPWDVVPTVIVNRIPALPLAETLISIAMHHRFDVFRSATNEARRSHHLTIPRLTTAAEPFLKGGVRHSRQLRSALDLLTETPSLSLSEWSDTFADWCVEQGLPRPVLEHRIHAGDGAFIAQVDLCWPDLGIAIELDSWAWHHSRASFESDRARYSRLSAEGWLVITVTWKRWRDQPDAIAAELRQAIATRRT